MLRLECACGKTLKVNETLIGKKIKCPGCAAIQLVRGASAGGGPLDERMSPALKSKAPLIKASPKVPALVKRKAAKEDEPPPRKKLAKKGSDMGLIIIAAALALLVVLAGGGFGAWFLFLRSGDNVVSKQQPKKIVTPDPTEKDDDDKPQKTAKLDGMPKGKKKEDKQDKKKDGQVAGNEPVTVRLFAPYKVGDVREIKMVALKKMEMKFADEAKVPAQFKDLMGKSSVHEKTTLRGSVTTLEVNAKGEETKVLVDLKEIKIEDLSGRDAPPYAPKDGKAVGTREGNRFKWSDPNDGGQSLLTSIEEDLGGFVSDRYMDLPTDVVARLYGFLEKRKIGDTWSVDKDELAKALLESDDAKGDGKKKSKVQVKDAKSKLVKIVAIDGKEAVQAELNLVALGESEIFPGQPPSPMNIAFDVDMTLPLDGLTGPLKKSAAMTLSSETEFPLGEVKTKMKTIIEQTGSVEIKYLGQSAKVDPPKAKAAQPVQGEGMAIKLFVPRKVGDRRQITSTEEWKLDYKVVDNAPEMQAVMDTLNGHNKAKLKGIWRTVEVNAKGEETKVEFTVEYFEVIPQTKNPGSVAFTIPKGTVLKGTLVGSQLLWSSSDPSTHFLMEKYMGELANQQYLQEPTSEADRWFGTPDKQSVGGTWKLNLPAITQELKKFNPIGGLSKPGALVSDVDGTGKLVSVSGEGDKKFADVELAVSFKETSDGDVSSSKKTVSVRLPLGQNSGPIKKQELAEFKGQGRSPKDGNEGKTGFFAVRTTLSMSVTTDIEYLGQAPKTEPPALKETKSGKTDASIIKLFVPRKIGEQREVKMVAVKKTDNQFVGNANKVPAEMKAAMDKESRHEKTTLHGVITTEEISGGGEETRILVDLKEVSVEDLSGKNTASKLPKQGKVLGTLKGTRFEWSDPNGGPSVFDPLAGLLRDFVANQHLELPESTVDGLLTPMQKQTVGGIWPIDKMQLGNAITEIDTIKNGGKAKAKYNVMDAAGKLVKVVSENGKDYLDLELFADVQMDSLGAANATGVMRWKLNLGVPKDGSTGPIKKTEAQDGLAEFEIPLGGADKALLKATMSLTTTTEIKYLGQAPKKEQPAAKDAKSGETGVTQIKLFVPRKVGDMREVKWVSFQKMEKNLVDEAKAPVEVKAKIAKENHNRRTTLEGTITTLEVNDSGEEIRVELDLKAKVEDFTSTKELPQQMTPQGKIMGIRKGSNFEWSQSKGGHELFRMIESELSEFVSDYILEFPGPTAEIVFGVRERKPFGEIWEIDAKRLGEALKERMDIASNGKNKSKMTITEAKGTSHKSTANGGRAYVQVEAYFKGTIEDDGSSGGGKIDGTVFSGFDVRVPADASTGFLMRTEFLEAGANIELSLGDYKFAVKALSRRNTTTEIKYLGQAPKSAQTVSPNPGTLVIELSNPKVERVDGRTMRFTVNYKIISGKPDPDKQYRLYVNLTSGAAEELVNPNTISWSALKTPGEIECMLVVAKGVGPDATFEMWLSEATLRNKKYEDAKVSAPVKGKVTGKAPAGPGKLPNQAAEMLLSIHRQQPRLAFLEEMSVSLTAFEAWGHADAELSESRMCPDGREHATASRCQPQSLKALHALARLAASWSLTAMLVKEGYENVTVSKVLSGEVTLASPNGKNSSKEALTASPSARQVGDAPKLRMQIDCDQDLGVLCLAGSSNGKNLASGGYDKNIKVWDVATGKNTWTLKGHTFLVRSVAFSPDSRILASAGDTRLGLWDIASGKNIAMLAEHTTTVESVAFHPKGTTLASGDFDGGILLWDVAAKKRVAALRGHSNAVWSLAFSPDGKTLASGSADKSVKLWDVSAGKVTMTFAGHTDRVMAVAYRPDGKLVASGGQDKTVNLWDVATGKNTLTLNGHANIVCDVAFSPDGKILASGSWDRTVILWDVATGKSMATINANSVSVHGLAFSPDGKTLSVGDGNTVKVWEIPKAN